MPLVTIDGETARDFDDAVFCEKQGRGWRLVVAIADVSHYVKPGMALDQKRWTVAILCISPAGDSDVAGEIVEWYLFAQPGCRAHGDGLRYGDQRCRQIGEYKFYPAVFRSKARLTYNQVWSWLSGEAKPESEIHIALQPQLKNLYKLFAALHKARGQRGAIDFETTETQMLFNEQGKIENIVPVVRNDAHRIIEECMLAANVCASDFLAEHKQVCLYRVHAAPSEEKLKNLRTFLGEFGMALSGGDDPQAKDYAFLLEQVKLRPDFQLLQTVMLRSLKQAMYSPDNVGTLVWLTRITRISPHRFAVTRPAGYRAIKAVLAKEKYTPTMSGTISVCTARRLSGAPMRRRAMSNWLKCFFMKERIGET